MTADGKARRARFLRSLRTVSETFEGRIVLARLLEKSGIYDDPIITEETHVTAGAMGKRTLGTWLRRELITVSGPDVLSNIENDHATTPMLSDA